MCSSDLDFEEWEQKRIKQMDTEIKAMENAKIPEPEIQIRKKEVEKEIKQKKSKSDAEIKVIEETYIEKGFDKWISKSLSIYILLVNEKAYHERYSQMDKEGSTNSSS